MGIKKISLYFIGLYFLSGCEVYDEGFDLTNSSDPCLESGANCSEPNGSNLLALSVTNTNPVVVKSSNGCANSFVPALNLICVFDISGLCNEGDYSQNIIEYRVYSIDTGVDVLPITSLSNICKRGRFRFQVGVAAGQVQTAKRLSIEILGRDLAGIEARNPLAARREVDLLLIPIPASP